MVADIITLLGTQSSESLQEYAARLWAGLMKDYYHGRWSRWYDYILRTNSSSYSDDVFETSIREWQEEWLLNDTRYVTNATGDAFVRSKAMFVKYSRLLRGSQPSTRVSIKSDDTTTDELISCRHPLLSELPYCNASLPMSDRADDLLARLNTTELVSQMQGTTPAAVPRLGLVEVTFGGEALHGVVADCINVSGHQRCPTQFPAPLALGSSFDQRLFRAVGKAISIEARALYHFGCPTCPPGKAAWGVEGPLFLAFYAPNANILRE